MDFLDQRYTDRCSIVQPHSLFRASKANPQSATDHSYWHMLIVELPTYAAVDDCAMRVTNIGQSAYATIHVVPEGFGVWK
jgi:hypothetical protein